MKLLLLCLSVAAAHAGLAPILMAKERAIPDSWIIKIKDFNSLDQVADDITSRFQRMRLQAPKVSKLRKLLPVLTLNIPARLIDDIRSIDGVEYIEQDMLTSLAAYQFNPTWGIDRIDSRDGTDGRFDYNPAVQGEGVDVYVVDTGIRTTHNAFGGRAKLLYGAADDHGHGTHCAGTAAGDIYGIARKANIYSVKVCYSYGCPFGTILNAFDAIVKHGGSKGGVVSVSLAGFSYSSTMNNAVQEMWDNGYLISHAAGNSNADACSYSPQMTDYLMVVAASVSTDRRASFSNYGSCVDIFAPGSGIKSAGHASDTAIAYKSGTSMACPHVTGAAALEFGRQANATPQSVKNALINNATKDKVSDTKGTPNRLLYVNYL